MPHVELSLPEEMPGSPVPPWVVHSDPIRSWSAVVESAAEPCLVVDTSGLVAACSPTAALLLGEDDPAVIVGRGLLDDVLQLVDFTGTGGRLADWELERVPPLRALSGGGLSRGLMRIRVGRVIRTVDAVSVPLRNSTELVGSLTFLARI